MADNPLEADPARKCFIPLENNPEVFTSLSHTLGLSHSLQFYDVYSLDSPESLSSIPPPVYALIFIAPAAVYLKRRELDYPPGSTITDKGDLPAYKGKGDKEPIIWYKQTIGHSCGLVALLHSLSNGKARNYVQPDSTLDKLIKAAIPLPMEERADLLYSSQELEHAHMSHARKGDTVAPDSRDPNGFHFISFVKGKDEHLWELEGGWNEPIDRGVLGKDVGVLDEKALSLGIRPFLERTMEGGGLDGEGFSIIALAHS